MPRENSVLIKVCSIFYQHPLTFGNCLKKEPPATVDIIQTSITITSGFVLLSKDGRLGRGGGTGAVALALDGGIMGVGGKGAASNTPEVVENDGDVYDKVLVLQQNYEMCQGLK